MDTSRASRPQERQTNPLKSKPSAKSEAAPAPKSALRENIEAIAVAVVLALFIRTFVVQAFKIPSGSMKDTLLIGDHILVNKFLYGVKIPFTRIKLIPGRDLRRGDIVVFEFPQDPSKDYIKRTIGLPGDIVEVRDKKLLVNNRPIDDPFGVYKDARIIPAGLQPRDNFGPQKVPPGAIFVMGDNRDYSYDSRFWGFVDTGAVKGRAFMIYWSWDKENFGGGSDWLRIWEWIRWERFGNMLK